MSRPAASRPRIVVAREAREAQRWADGLRQRGFDAQAFEGLHIQNLLQPLELRALHERMLALTDLVAVMAVSANAVQAFWGSQNANLVENCQGVIVSIASVATNFDIQHWVTGPNSAAALRALGVASDSIVQPVGNGSQDSEALLAALKNQLPQFAGKRVWIIRGEDAVSTGRPWLAQQLLEHGMQVEEQVVYRRDLPLLSAGEIAEARASFSRGDTWIFANGAVLQNLCAQANFSAAELAAVHIRSTHPRIAQLARALGAVRVDNGDLGHSLDAWQACLKSAHV